MGLIAYKGHYLERQVSNPEKLRNQPRAMKILHVIATLAPYSGGPPKACVGMARAVAGLGHQVSIYTTNLDGKGELKVPTDRPVWEEGVEIRFFPIQAPRFWGTSWPLARALREHLREFDVVHMHSLYLFHDLVTGHFCRTQGIPYLMMPHGALDPYIYRRHRWRKKVMESLFENRNIKQAAALHFTCEEEKRLAAPYVGKTSGVVMPLGLDLREYENLPPPGEFRRRFSEVLGKRIILFLGRLNFIKGLDIMVKAFARVAREREDIHLVLAGPADPGYEEKVRGWLAAEGMLARATFTGMLRGEEKLAVLRDADLFVLPSLSENFGIAVIEAMACGLPVIISDQVKIWREVEAAEAGRVGPCRAEWFAGAMEELLAREDWRRRLGEGGRALVRERFQWTNIASLMEKTYISIIEGQTP
jgi:glycosyltransferase involved in cell wall biosynthesis